MNEKLFQFIWQFQYYNRSSLVTESGDLLTIHKPGTLNTNQGPDFLNAQISIGDIQLVGNIELHINSSDWLKHQHQSDYHYGNIILHVVWQHDTNVVDIHQQKLPVLELQSRVPKTLIDGYLAMMLMPNMPCQKILKSTLNEIGWISWKERLVAERLQRKSAKVLALFQQSNQHWEEVFWWQLASNFGMKVNSDLLMQMAQSIPVNLLAKHKNNLLQLEALLLGQSNLLNAPSENSYVQTLQKEYTFLQKKYQLTANPIQPKFLRMRPANFPTIRLAQLAVLVHQSVHLFSKIKSLNSVKEVKELFAVTASSFWNNRYTLEKENTEILPKQVGEETVQNIIINTIAPILFAYGLFMKDEQFKEKAIQWLSETKAESNEVTISWKNMKYKVKTALDSQAFIELTNEYCNQKRCLECAVGNSILKSKC